MLLFLPDDVKNELAVFVVIMLIIAAIATCRPDIAWLEAFRFQNRLTADQKARLRRSQNRIAGAEFILLGLIVPMVYAGMNFMFFSAPTLGLSLLTGAISLTCIVIGIVAIVKTR